MKDFFKADVKILLLRLAQVVLFLIPFAVFSLIYREKFFTEQTGWGVTGLFVIGIVIWVLALAKIIGRMPKIFWFLFLFILFEVMSFLADYLRQIGFVILIGAILALPINFLIRAYTITGKTSLEERTREKVKKKMKKEEIEIEVE